MPTPTVKCKIDGWVEEDHTMRNHGSETKLSLNGDGSHTRYSYMFFARPFPFGCQVGDAELQVRLRKGWSGGPHTITAKRIVAKWSEDQLRWANRPSVTGTNSATAQVTAGSAFDLVTFNVTNMMQDVANGGGWHGIRLEVNTTGIKNLVSAEAGAEYARPQLYIEFSLKPATPEGLRPANGQKVSKLKPMLEWDLPTRSRDDMEQAASQVQISTSTDFGTPEYDSTMTANTEPYWDLNQTGYAGVPEDATRYWRVRLRNEDLRTSDWSDTAEFVRDSKATLTITSPGATVDQTTPPVSWTFSGKTQSAASIILERKLVFDDGSTYWWRLWTMPRTVTTETSFDVPNGLIKTGHTFRVKVRVWDTEDRQAVGGDPTFVQDTQEFTYSRNGTPSSPTNFSVSQGAAGGPSVKINWTDTTTPDYFCLVEDGEEVDDRIDPEDVRIGATNNFELTWWRSVPDEEHEYEIERVVNDDHSDNNPTATYTPTPGSKWLIDDSDLDSVVVVEMLGKDAADLSIGETGETFNLVGQRAPVRIIDSQRGLEGTVNGILDGETMRKRFQTLKRRNNQCRYIQGTINIPVILGEASISPSPDADLYDVSVEVYQSDDFLIWA